MLVLCPDYTQGLVAFDIFHFLGLKVGLSIRFQEVNVGSKLDSSHPGN